MMVRRSSRHIVLVVFREDQLESRTFRIPLWALRLAGAGVVALLIAALLGVALAAPVTRAAARVPGLEREVERLEGENARVEELAATLDSMELAFGRLREMVGADIVPAVSVLAAGSYVAPAIVVTDSVVQVVPAGGSLPSRWPLDDPGFVTRGASDTTGQGDEPHPGLDIAVREGSLVRAAGGGTVVEAGAARDYGLYVLLLHPDGHETMYGHLSRIVVRRGAQLREGDVLGLSGNTGRSSAPHLHFEVRVNGQAVDPTQFVKENP